MRWLRGSLLAKVGWLASVLLAASTRSSLGTKKRIVAWPTHTLWFQQLSALILGAHVHLCAIACVCETCQ